MNNQASLEKPGRRMSLLDNYRSLAIVTAFLLFAFTSFAQVRQGVRLKNQAKGFDFKEVATDSLFRPPLVRLPLLAKDSGAISIDLTLKKLLFFNKAGAWDTLTGSGGGGLDTSITNDLYAPLVDTLIYIDSVTLKGVGAQIDPLTAKLPNVVVANVAGIRAISSRVKNLSTTFKSANPGLTPNISEWVFVLGDVTTPDDSVMNVRDAANTGTYKRIVPGDMVDARWWQVVGDYATDNSYRFTKMVNYVTTHADCPKKIYFPRGQYMFASPILVYNWDGTHYQPVKFELVGESEARVGLTDLAVSFKATSALNNLFLLGIQRGYGVKITNIEFIGGYTKARTFSQLDIIRKPFSQWTQTGIRDTRYSPNCLINIDPFGISTPADGGYPGYTSFYRGAFDDYGGSSDIQITNCRFSDATVAVAVSINGFTLNAEQIHIRESYFGYCKIAYAVGQAQAVTNEFNDNRIWTPVHTIIDGVNYGEGTGAAPTVNGMNIAGGDLGVYQLINVEATRQPQKFVGIRGESLFRIGNVNQPSFTSNFGASFINCYFHFWDPGQFDLPTPDYIVQGKVSFINTDMYYVYGSDYYRLKLNNTYLDASFNGGTTAKLLVSRPGLRLDDNVVQMNNVTTFTGGARTSAGRSGTNTLAPSWLTGSQMGQKTRLKFTEQNGVVDYTFNWDETNPDGLRYVGAYTIKNSGIGNGNDTIVISGASTKVRVGDVLISDSSKHWLSDKNPDLTATPYFYYNNLYEDGAPTLGSIVAIRGDSVFLKGAGVNVPVGTTTTVPVYVNWNRTHTPPMSGTIAAGSAIITNVEILKNVTASEFTVAIGQRLEHPAFPAGAWVTAVTSTTITMSEVATLDFPHAFFCNGSPDITATSVYDPGYAINTGHANLYEGTKWVQKRPYYQTDPYKYKEFRINRTTFVHDNGSAYVASTLHPVSYSEVAESDDEQIDWTGRATYPSSTNNTSIQVGGGGIQSLSSANMILMANLFYNTIGFGGWARSNTGAGSALVLTDAGAINFYSAPSGTGGLATSVTQTFGVDIAGVANSYGAFRNHQSANDEQRGFITVASDGLDSMGFAAKGLYSGSTNSLWSAKRLDITVRNGQDLHIIANQIKAHSSFTMLALPGTPTGAATQLNSNYLFFHVNLYDGTAPFDRYSSIVAFPSASTNRKYDWVFKTNSPDGVTGGKDAIRIDTLGQVGIIHLKALGSSPTITAGTGAGTGGIAQILFGGDAGFAVSIATGASPAAAGAVVATITFAAPFTGTAYPIVTWAPVGNNYNLTAVAGFGFIPSTTGIEIRCANTLAASTTYQFNIITMAY